MKVCATCGEQNSDRAEFCQECAAPLAEAAPRQEERKVVRVLFADLVGFTSRSERMDVEDVRGTLQPYHQLLRRELERHGGTVEKFIGDAVMALFRAPVAHEDYPERAVRAALAIQEAVARLREQDERLDLHVRIGVNTGEALVALGARPSEGEGMASGDVVNTAARLQSAAPVDGVLVGEVTYRATDRVIRYERAEPVRAKGKTEPVRVWLALAPRSLVPEQARRGDLPLVGREKEVASLVAALERSIGGHAVKDGKLPGNPCGGVKRTREVVKRPRVLTPIEVERMRACMPSLRDAVLLELMAYAGLRPAEAIALTWDSVTEHMLIVDQSYAYGEMRPTKTGRRRTVDLVEPLADDLGMVRPHVARPGELVAPTRSGEPFNLRNWRRRVWRPACEQAGIDANPYDARHAYCSLLAHEGRSAPYIAAMMGHSLTDTQRYYAHVIDDTRLAPMTGMVDTIRLARADAGVPAKFPSEEVRLLRSAV